MSWSLTQEVHRLDRALAFLHKMRAHAQQQARLLDRQVASVTSRLRRCHQAALRYSYGLRILVTWHVAMAYTGYAQRQWVRSREVVELWSELTGEELWLEESPDYTDDDSYLDEMLRDDQQPNGSQDSDGYGYSAHVNTDSEMDRQLGCFTAWDVLHRAH